MAEPKTKEYITMSALKGATGTIVNAIEEDYTKKEDFNKIISGLETDIHNVVNNNERTTKNLKNMIRQKSETLSDKIAQVEVDARKRDFDIAIDFSVDVARRERDLREEIEHVKTIAVLGLASGLMSLVLAIVSFTTIF